MRLADTALFADYDTLGDVLQWVWRERGVIHFTICGGENLSAQRKRA